MRPDKLDGPTHGYRHDGRFALPRPAPEVRVRAPVAERLTGAKGCAVVVTAPGGYGKSSQIAAWAHQDDRPVAWVDLELADNEPGALLTLLGDLLRSVTDLELTEEAAALAGGGQMLTTVAPLLADAVSRTTKPFLLVLDDLHLIEDAIAIDLVSALLDDVPSAATIVLIGRSTPAMSLARVRAHGGLVEMSTDQLALDAGEARDLLDRMGVTIGEAELARLVEATEGWPVGLRLAALALRDDQEVAASLEQGSWGPDLAIAGYVREEWLRGLPDDDVWFLMRVSGLDWLSGSVCDSVLGRSDSGETLRRLHANRTMVIPVDRRGDAYRLHRLFRDVLDREFEHVDRAGRQEIDTRASAWFERAGDIDRAVRHALRAGDLVRATALIGEHALPYFTRGQSTALHHWLESFQLADVTASPDLCLTAALAAFGSGDSDAVPTWLELAGRALAGPGAAPQDPFIAHKLATFRAVISTGPAASALADVTSARYGLPAGPWRVIATQTCAALHYSLGHKDEAIALLSEATAEARVLKAPTTQATGLSHLALIRAQDDDWDRAVPLARRARELVRVHGLEGTPTTALTLAMSALAEAAAGDPAVARDERRIARRNLAYLSRLVGWGNVQARVALARASLLLGDRAGARALVDEAEEYLGQQPDAVTLHAEVAALEAQLRTARVSLPPGPSSLTTAELKVLHFLPTNLTLGEIAARLFVSRNTAKSHAASVYRKLGTRTRGEAVELARAAGLLPGSDATVDAEVRRSAVITTQ